MLSSIAIQPSNPREPHVSPQLFLGSLTSIVLAGACAVLTSGQTTLPASLATLIPSATPAPATDSSHSQPMPLASSSPSPTAFQTIKTTDSAGSVEASTHPKVSESTPITTPKDDNTSTGALIGGMFFSLPC